MSKLVLLAPLAIATVARASPIRATIVDGETLEPIANATARANGRAVAVDRGELVIDEASEALEVSAAAPGYTPETQRLIPGSEPALVVLFKTGALDEVIVVEAQAPRSVTDGSYLITRDELRGLAGGSKDALAAVRSLPGVASAPPIAAGRLVIRGGAPQDSLLTLDGVPVPFVYHGFDQTTIIPVSMIGAIAYSPGGFGVEEGRATSGAVAISTTDEPPRAAGVRASLSMLDVSASGETPLGRGLYLAGGLRRSTVDVVMPIADPGDGTIEFTTPPRYYDGHLRLDWLATGRDRVMLLGIASYDRLGVVNRMPDSQLPSDFATEARFSRLIASWKHETTRVRNRAVAAVGEGDLHVTYDTVQFIDARQSVALVRDDLSIEASSRVRVRAGAMAQTERNELDARTIVVPPDGLPAGQTYRDLPIKTIAAGYDASYVAAYAAADVRPTATTTLALGTRIEHFARIAATVVEPRADLAQRVGALTLRASAGRYARDPSQLQGLPTDLSPELATQLSVGTEVAVSDGLAASAAVYHTSRDQLAVEDPERMTASELVPYKSTGLGTTHGVDLLLRLHRDRLFGWVAYTYSRTTRQSDAGAPAHPTAFDQTHALSLVAGYEVGGWRFGARAQLASGLPHTDVVGAVYSDELGRYLPLLGAPNGVRYPDSARLDLRVEREWQTEHVKLAAFVDIGNVFRSARVHRYAYSADFASREPISEYIPLPSIGIRGEL